MKIKIELTKTEVKKFKSVATKVANEVVSLCDDRDLIKDAKKEIREGINGLVEDSRAIAGNFGDATIIPDNGTLTYEINLKSKFTVSLLHIVEIFYVGFAKFINKIKKPVEEFVETYIID